MEEGLCAVYPGTFDPPTLGHLDIIQRASRIARRLVIGVAKNPGKGPLFDIDQRVAMVRDEVDATLPADVAGRVEVVPFADLLIHFVAAQNATMIIRGLRAPADFEYEIQMAAVNSRLDPSVETVFLMAAENHQFISSRFVKEVAYLGGDVASFASPRIAERVRKRFIELGRRGAEVDGAAPGSGAR